jgi:hypothetical protein
MAFISQQYVAITGATLTASIWNDEFTNLINAFNGGIDNANIASAAGIAYSKLALTGAVLNADLAGSIAASKITDTAVTLTASQTLTNKTLTGAVANATVHPITTVTYAGSLVFDGDISNHFICTLTGSPIITFQDFEDGQCWIIHLKQDGSGNHTVTWPTTRWAGGVTPTLTTTGNKIDTLGFIKNGADYYGYVIGKNI